MFQRQTPGAIAPLIGVLILGLVIFASTESKRPSAAESRLDGTVQSPIFPAGPFSPEMAQAIDASVGGILPPLADIDAPAIDIESLWVRIYWRGCGLGLSFSDGADRSRGGPEGLAQARGASLERASFLNRPLLELDLSQFRRQNLSPQDDRSVVRHLGGAAPYTNDRNIPDPSLLFLAVHDGETGSVPRALEISWMPMDRGSSHDLAWQTLDYDPERSGYILTVDPGPIRLRIGAQGYFGMDTQVTLGPGFSELSYQLAAQIRTDLAFISRSGPIAVDLSTCEVTVSTLGRHGRLRFTRNQSLFFTREGSYQVTIGGIQGYAPVTFVVAVNRTEPRVLRVPISSR